MSHFQVVVTTVLTMLTLLAFSVVAAWSLWPHTVEASATIAAHSAGWQSGSDQDANHCSALGAGHLKVAQAIAAVTLDLDEGQQQAIEPVFAILENWRANATVVCENTDLNDMDSSLQGLQTMMAQTADSIDEVRPLVSEFYASLSDEQRQTIQSHMSSHRGHRGFFRHRRSH